MKTTEEEKSLPKQEQKETVHKEPVQTEKVIQINKHNLKYQTTTGTIKINKNKDSEADVFFVAYTLLETPKNRPICFAFNGGPGSSSVWLHMGALAPKRVSMDKEGFPLPPPYKIIENEHTWLSFTDIVFIDPVGTGYSNARDKKDARGYHNVETDVKSMAKFIRSYLTKYKRWDAPKFIAGESYGSLRAAALSELLETEEGVYLNGVILISTILNLLTGEFDDGNDLPFILYIPNYAATAWYHKKLPPKWQNKTLQELLKASGEFALKEYALVLLQGDVLAQQKKEEILLQLAEFTGISQEYWQKNNLRISLYRFIRELLRNEYKIVGRLDSRFSGYEPNAAGDDFTYDPSYSAILGPFTQALNHYMYEDLEYQSDLKYRVLNTKVHPWNWKAENKYLNVAPKLRSAMMHNPHLKVLVASGYYDLATPYFAVEYTFNHMNLSPELAKNVSFTYYESGHMMYIQEEALKKFTTDVKEFIINSIA